MKLFLIGLAHGRKGQVDVARALRRHHEISYWVRMNEIFRIDESEFPETVFHDYRDAIKGKPANGIDPFSFEPWSVEDIDAYASAERDFMSMADKWYPNWPVNRRKDFWYGLLSYWGGVVEQFWPDRIVFLTVPHEMYSFALYCIAKRRGIRTLVLDDTVLDATRYVLIEDYKTGSDSLARALDGRTATLDELSDLMRAYYVRVSKGKNPEPPLMEAFHRWYTPWQQTLLWIRVSKQFIKDGTFFERAVKKVFKTFKPDLKDECRIYERPADFGKPYVYFPLHYQPEATTAPLGGVYVDQLLAIKTAAAALPAGWELYVKEHPAQMTVHGGNETTGRWKGFYKTIAEIPHVRLVPIGTNTFVLSDHARATATMTGTAAWEAIMRGKPALVFGYPWFQHAPGIMRVGSVDDCRAAFEKIAEGFAPNEHDILRYLHVLDTVSHVGSIYKDAPGGENQWKEMLQAIECFLATGNDGAPDASVL